MDPQTQSMPPPPRKRKRPAIVHREGTLRYKYMDFKEFKKYYYINMEIDDQNWIRKEWDKAEHAALFDIMGKKVECVRVLIDDISEDMPPPSSRTPTERRQSWPRDTERNVRSRKV